MCFCSLRFVVVLFAVGSPGCTEKADFIKRVRETANADSADADEALPVVARRRRHPM